MCGFSGFWSFKNTQTAAMLEQLVEKMAARLQSRGPDDAGTWSEPGSGVAFGHRRLSIVDLSPLGHQPLYSRSERYVIAYNGEVYNASTLRDRLVAEGRTFRGTSDTEVIVEACDAWGVEEAVSQFIGMFAFALWDVHEKRLFLVRDRLGIKPLYWGFQGDTLFFGSQLKSFEPHPAWNPSLNVEALPSYFRLNYIKAPNSIYTDIYKLEPGQILTIDRDRAVRRVSYWSMPDVIQKRKTQTNTSSEEILQDLEGLLKDAVKSRMIADVPLGAFLSGGIDSSLVVALMQAQSETPVKSFSIGFHEKGYDEAQHAQAVAAHLKTDHHTLYIPPEDAQAVIPSLGEWYDEPFADSSQIPTYLVSKMAREHVKVALSGDGGDELFAGYTRYFLGEKLWRRFGAVPLGMRRFFQRGIQGLSPAVWSRMGHLLPERIRPPHLGDKAHKLAALLPHENIEDFYTGLISLWESPADLLAADVREHLAAAVREDHALAASALGPVEAMQYWDTQTYLPDDILTKVDRASMAVSLEARVPLLDHRVVEKAWQLPLNFKVRDGQGKWALRQILYKYVPQSLIDRPKMGFGIPLDQWLRGPLKAWASDLLSPEKIKQQGILSPELIKQKWQQHLSGSHNHQYALWGVLMFQDFMYRTQNSLRS